MYQIATRLLIFYALPITLIVWYLKTTFFTFCETFHQRKKKRNQKFAG